jgi:hypothetical protein
MDAAIIFFLLVFLVLVVLGVGVTALIIVIYRFNRRVMIPAIGGSAGKAEAIMNDWAAEHDYQLLDLIRVTERRHPFADRFGVGWGKWPGVVYFVEVRTRKKRTRTGWVYMRIAPFGIPLRETLEVLWDRA